MHKNFLTKFCQVPPVQMRNNKLPVYTQTTDVEGEVNGLITYDRSLIKLNPEWLSKKAEPLFR